MKLCLHSTFSVLLSLAVCGLCCCSSAVAADLGEHNLNADSIADSSLSVAGSMKTSGYCYTGVSRALAPLGVSLTGEAAYQAREQLLADARFVPVAMSEDIGLRRGDILVFNKSETHPYGHICVYQGNGEESSDHISHLTSPDAYGGVTVFRLGAEDYPMANAADQGEWTYKMPVSAPDFRHQNSALPFKESPRPSSARYGDTKAGTVMKSAAALLNGHFHFAKSSTTEKALTKKLLRFVLRNL